MKSNQFLEKQSVVACQLHFSHESDKFSFFYFGFCSSPDGKKCRSKPQMLQYLPEDYDLENFEFSSGRNINVLLRKRKRRKDDFNFCKDFNISGSHIMPRRQMKKMREKVVVNHMNMQDVEGMKDENKERILRKYLQIV